MPRIISITAPANGSGKTSLIATILREHPGLLTALKASTVYRDGKHCPRSNTGCACRRLEGAFTVISDPAVIDQPGTDTGRFVAAGAARTLWCLARPGAHADLWKALLSGALAPEEPIIAEGSGAIEVMQPERIVMVVSPEPPRERWKESAWPMIARADLVILNDRDGGDGARRLEEEISVRAGRRAIRQDVARPLAEWGSPELAGLLSGFAPPRRG